MRVLELRVPPAVVGLVVAGGMWTVSWLPPIPASAGVVRLWIALVAAAIGVAVALGGVVSFRRAHTMVNPSRPETSAALVSTGVYSFTRNPMYLGMALALAGWGLYLASVWSALGPALFALYITQYQIIPEERVLDRLFGAPFVAYEKQVRRWL